MILNTEFRNLGVLDTAFTDTQSFETNLTEHRGTLMNDYEGLINLPTIEQKTIIGDMVLEDIGMHFLTNSELEQLLK